MKKQPTKKTLELKKKTITALKAEEALLLAGGLVPASRNLTCYCDSAGCPASRTCC